MNIKKPLIATGVVSAIAVATLLGTQVASAHDIGGGNMADKLASRFNLNRDEVQKVFDENRAEHEAEHKTKLTERLDQAVKDGKISSEQKDKIIAKLDELKSKREELKDKTPQERHDAMEQNHKDLQQWLKDNSIPTNIFPFGPERGHHGHGPKNDL